MGDVNVGIKGRDKVKLPSPAAVVVVKGPLLDVEEDELSDAGSTHLVFLQVNPVLQTSPVRQTQALDPGVHRGVVRLKASDIAAGGHELTFAPLKKRQPFLYRAGES